MQDLSIAASCHGNQRCAHRSAEGYNLCTRACYQGRLGNAMQDAGPLGNLSGHVIICGAEGSFVNFVEQLRRCDPMPTPVVVLHPRRPSVAWTALKALGPVHFVAGTAESPQQSLSSDAPTGLLKPKRLCDMTGCLQSARPHM